MDRSRPPRAVDRRAGRGLPSLVRARDWWSFKLPPLLAVAYLLLARPEPAPLFPAFAALALFLVSGVASAAFGHLVNDWTDLAVDARAGKRRRLASLPTSGRLAVTGGALALAVAPWWALPPSPAARALFAAELLLFLAYSLPPLRLKERGAAGLVADALYGQALPMGIVVFLFPAVAGRAPLAAAPAAALLVWGMVKGLCDALAGQIEDRRADRRSGQHTFVLALGARPAHRLLVVFLLPAQLLAFAVALLALAPLAPWLPLTWLLFLAATLYRIHGYWRRPFARHLRGYAGVYLLNDFQERWLPLATLAAPLSTDVRFAPLALLHLALFRNGFGDLLAGARFLREARRRRQDLGPI